MPSRASAGHKQPEPSPDYREMIGQERERLERVETRLQGKITRAEQRQKEETSKVERRLRKDLDRLTNKVDQLEPKVWMMWGGIALVATIAAILARLFI